jgi:hypothetical protein
MVRSLHRRPLPLQGLLTLNLFRESRIKPNLSAWAQVHEAFDYNSTPLAPPRPLLVYETESLRGTWTPHAVDGWYIGYCEWIAGITAERIDDTMV